ncbi:Protein of unknown function UPF0254 [Methanospirillum hungatei JF-1]|jgi:uncharacterized protein (UPF0254 family)|uniref:UPF0254 protein Mhun_0230 n=1 Tax=Methanospirillum hungatei JF-1 (strain ATCC 27890 / DSM 864 / NBRC 100397 / JF-1) TaxID=323259 RepID=Q2FR48_METHJ|nr:UPF0254 family protein [Methanospirillum hungatei]ABD40002.1 Protein of unknown function UPF0254 [Methanospirillum hungatei JF-1]
MVIRVALAECFTHGLISREIHAFSMGYPLTYHWSTDPEDFPISVIAGLFIPTLSGIRTILHFEPLPPAEVINDIKIYNQDQDLLMAFLMAQAVKNLTCADIGIGTCAGVGKGGIALVYEKGSEVITSEHYADLRFSSACEIMSRQKSGVVMCLRHFESILNTKFKNCQKIIPSN